MKLTQPQRRVLEDIAAWSKGRPFMSAHITYAPLRRLIAKHAVEKVRGRTTASIYLRITEAGRSALQDKDAGGGA